VVRERERSACAGFDAGDDTPMPPMPRAHARRATRRERERKKLREGFINV
jgi:hypothetical protein